ncbi:MAG: hypothetical protein HRT88_17080 [Lentisphaeraceae bacterium]|nr:hypothetical protein [Lentisphaeraceae bacterium]
MTKTDQLKTQKLRAARKKEVKQILKDNPDMGFTKMFWTSVRDPKSIQEVVQYVKNL